MKVFAMILVGALVALDAQAQDASVTQEINSAISHADSILLLSLEPGEKGSRDSHGECYGLCYFRWPVLGQTIVPSGSDKSFRQDLSAWVAAPHPHAIAMCFNPRHGVRIEANGHTYDFVICYQCARAEVFRDSAEQPIAHLYYKSSSQQSWDGLLRAVHVPLAAPVPLDGT